MKAVIVVLAVVLLGLVADTYAQAGISIGFQFPQDLNPSNQQFVNQWNRLRVILQPGSITSDLTYKLQLSDPDQDPCCYWSLNNGPAPDPTDGLTFQSLTEYTFTIPAGDDAISLFFWPYRGDSCTSSTGTFCLSDWDVSNVQYDVIGPGAAQKITIPSTITLNPVRHIVSYEIVAPTGSGTNSAGYDTVTGLLSGRDGNVRPLEFRTLTLNGTSRPDILMVAYQPDSTDLLGYAAMNAIDQNTYDYPASSGQLQTNTLTLVYPWPEAEIVQTTSSMGFVATPQWLWRTVSLNAAPFFSLSVAPELFGVNANSFSGAAGDNTDLIIGITNTDSVSFTLVPSDGTPGWNIDPNSVSNLQISSGTSVTQSITFRPPTGTTFIYDIIPDNPRYAIIRSAVSITTVQKSVCDFNDRITSPTCEMYARVEFSNKGAGSSGFSNFGPVLPGENITVTLIPNNQISYSVPSRDYEFQLVIVPLDESQNNDSIIYTNQIGSFPNNAAFTVRPQMTATFTAYTGSFAMYVLPMDDEYEVFSQVSSLAADGPQCDTTGNNGVSSPHVISFGDYPQNIAPNNLFSFDVSFTEGNPDDSLTVTLNADDLAVLSQYVRFLNTTNVPVTTSNIGAPPMARIFYEFLGPFPLVPIPALYVRIEPSDPSYLPCAWAVGFLQAATANSLTLISTPPFTPGQDLIYELDITDVDFFLPVDFSIGVLSADGRLSLVDSTITFNQYFPTLVQFNVAYNGAVYPTQDNVVFVHTPVHQAGATDEPGIWDFSSSGWYSTDMQYNGEGLLGFDGRQQLSAGDTLTLNVGESAPLFFFPDWAANSLDSLETSSEVINIAPFQPTHSVVVGTFDRTSYQIDPTGTNNYDVTTYFFNFTATAPGSAYFLVTSQSGSYTPILFEIEVVDNFRALTGAAEWTQTMPSQSLFLGSLNAWWVGVSAAWLDSDLRVGIEWWGTAEVSFLYPYNDTNGYYRIPRGVFQVPFYFSCQKTGTLFWRVWSPDSTELRGHLDGSASCVDSNYYLVPSAIPPVPVHQKLYFTLVHDDRTPSGGGRNESITWSFALSYDTDNSLISYEQDIPLVEFSPQQLYFGKAQRTANFMVKTKAEGVARISVKPSNYAGQIAGGASSDTSLYFRIGAGGRRWNLVCFGSPGYDFGYYIQWALSTDNTDNNVYTCLTFVPRSTPSDVWGIWPIEMPVRYNVTWTGDGGAALYDPALSNYKNPDQSVSALTNLRYITDWDNPVDFFQMKVSSAGFLQLAIYPQPLTLTPPGEKKPVTWLQTAPWDRQNILITEPTQVLDSAADYIMVGLTVKYYTVQMSGPSVQIVLYHENPVNPYTLSLLPVQAGVWSDGTAASVSITGPSGEDLTNGGVTLGEDSSQVKIISITAVSPGPLHFIWQSTKPGYEPLPYDLYVYVSPAGAAGVVPPRASLVVGAGNSYSYSTSDLPLRLGDSFPVQFSAVQSSAVLGYTSETFSVDFASNPGPVSMSSNTLQFSSQSTVGYLVATADNYGLTAAAVRPTNPEVFTDTLTYFVVGDLVYVENWQPYLRPNYVYDLQLTRTARVPELFWADARFTLGVADGDNNNDNAADRSSWGFKVYQFGNEQTEIVIPANESSTWFQVTVDDATAVVTFATLQSQTAGYTALGDGFFSDKYRLVSKKLLEAVFIPRVSWDYASVAWFHCPAENALSSSVPFGTFSVYPDHNLHVYPTTFTCSQTDTVQAIYVWGEPDRLTIVSQYARAAYDLTGNQNDAALASYDGFGSRKSYDFPYSA